MSGTGIDALADRTLLVGYPGIDPPEWIRRAAPRLGAVVLYGSNLGVDGDAARIADALRAGGDVLIAIDEEGGDVTRLHYHSGSPVPGNHVLGTVDEVAATEAVARVTGAELRAAGILWDFAPVADVNVDPENPVIGVRAFGGEPDRVARHTAAWIRGLQATGVAGCAKHFPGHGDTRTDSHLGLPTVTGTAAQWRAVHAPPFAAAVAAGVRSVMTAHVKYPAFDELPATLSRRILVGLLREELSFEGVVVTDALDMAALAAGYGPVAAAVAALAAGADALCLGGGDEAYYRRIRDGIVDAVRSGELPHDRLVEAAERVDRLHAWVAAARDTAGNATSGAGPGAVRAGAEVGAGVDLGVGLARRAAVTRGIPPLAGRPVVVELRADPNLAVGAAAWDLAGPLRDLGYPPVRTIVVARGGPTGSADGADGAVGSDGVGGSRGVLAAAAGHPLIVVGRDVVRHPWQLAVWSGVRAARPDAVLVDLGLPRPGELGEGRYLLVGGAARPNLRVAAEMLVAGASDGRPQEEGNDDGRG